MNSLKSKNMKWLTLPVISLCIAVLYFLLVRNLLGSTATQVELFVLGGLALVAIGILLLGLLTLSMAAFSKKRHTWLKKFGWQMLFLLIVIVMLTGLVQGT